MWRFLVRRILLGIAIVFFGALVTYAVLRALPTSYVESIARQRSQMPGSKTYTEWVAQLNAIYRLDKGIIPGYFGWLGDFLKGNFGDSWLHNIPVTQKFSEVIGYSAVLAVCAFVFEILVAIPLGVLAARKQYSKTDYAVTVFALIGISLPSFFFATTLKYIFAVKLGWFDLYGIVGRYHMLLNSWGQFWDIAAHMVLPVITLMMQSVGGLMRFTRTNMLEVLNSDYIRTARAKGLPEKKVINRHAFRNTLVPLISYMSYLLPSLFSGALITETIFQIPGIGYTSYQAMTGGDIPMTMFYVVFITVLTQVSLLIADIMYAVADPRVRIN